MKKFMICMAVLSMLLGFAGCGSSSHSSVPSSSSSSASEGSSSEGSSSEPEPQEDPIETMIAEMTVEQKLAQMIIAAMRSDADNTYAPEAITDDYKELLSRYDFGGVILFAGSVIDPEQTVRLIDDMQNAALGSEKGIGMFVSVDQEGGLVNRVSYGTSGSGNMALAAAGNPSYAEEIASIMGQEIKALGFNMDFAPVSDVNNNPANPIIGVRSFSDDPAIAAEYVKAFLKGMKQAGICSSLKHFPGHGNVGEDSHTHLPLSGLSLEELRQCELVPFKAGIEAGTEMIMTAHIQFPQIEKTTYISKLDGREVCLPATLSPVIIRDLLRTEMGYDGIVITDAMVMEAIASHFDRLDAAVMAINAGVDILLCPFNIYKDGGINTFPDVDAYMQGLTERVENGEIKEEELDDSVYRILKLKEEKGILHLQNTKTLEERITEAKETVGSAEHLKKDWEITQAGMTLLKNDNGALPLKTDRSTLVLVPYASRKPGADYAVTRLVREGILADASRVNVMNFAGYSAWDTDIQNALAACEQLVVMSQSVYRNEELVNLMNQAHQNGKKVVLVSLNIPYDAACYPEADAILCAYNPYGKAYDAEGNGPFNLNVAVALCTAFGESAPSGTLPVNIPQVSIQNGEVIFLNEMVYQRGYGLKNWGN